MSLLCRKKTAKHFRNDRLSQPVRLALMIVMACAAMLMVRPSQAQTCSDVTATTFAQYQAAVTDYNTNCDNGETLTVDLAGNTLTYTTLLTELNNNTTAKLFIKNGTLDANSQGHVLLVVDGDVTFDTMLLTGGTGPNGGAIQLEQDTNGTLINTTVTGNTSLTAAALLNNGGTLTLTNVTVSDNTIAVANNSLGSVWNRINGSTPVLNLNNSIIANTVDTNGLAVPDCRNNSGTVNFSAGQSNLIEQDQTGGVACDLAGTNTLSGDPSLGLLQDNGGQSNTLALLPSSTAINAGNNAVCAAAPVNNLDQRGVTRPQGSVCDIGAFEFEGFGSLSIVKAADPEDGTDFAFTSDIAGGGSFTLDVDSDGTYADTITFADTPIGTYAITELVPQNWQLDSASCTGGADSGSLNGETLTVSLAEDEAITCTFNNRYEDDDSIVADEEDTVPGYNGSAQGDGNGDSIADKLQATVSSAQDAASGCWWTIETDGVQHRNVALEAIPADVPPGTYPCNFASFEVALAQAQTQLQLTLYFSPRNPTIQGVLKFNHLSEQWDMIGTVDHSGDKTIVRYSLSDGGPYDDDRAEDGRIQDPVGAVSPPSVIPTLSPVGLGVLVVAWALLLLIMHRR